MLATPPCRPLCLRLTPSSPPRVTHKFRGEEQGKFQFTQARYRVPGDRAQVEFVLKRQEGSGAAKATLTYKTVDGSAKAGSEYMPKSGRVVFEAGEMMKVVEVLIYARDDSVHRTTRFTMAITGCRGGQLVDHKGQGVEEGEGPLLAQCTIVDDKPLSMAVLEHASFQLAVSVCTLYALFVAAA